MRSILQLSIQSDNCIALIMHEPILKYFSVHVSTYFRLGSHINVMNLCMIVAKFAQKSCSKLIPFDEIIKRLMRLPGWR